MSIQAVLLDLDGTLADTAPDLGYALNQVRATRNLPPLPLSETRPVTSNGVRGLLKVGFDITPEHGDYAALKDQFLEIYTVNLCRETRLFPGMAELLAELEQRRVPWGVVTNKPQRFTEPLLGQLGVRERAACVISGDSVGHLKPHPAPLLAAATTIGVASRDCLYFGDDARDVVAARAAGMPVAVARFGYLNGGAPETWGADALLDHPLDLLELL
ncbi:MAG TPA: phosphoglycolate phosphatase [Burkholderiales bacterium]|nr:phosphoglycolate phosphatase [Burkholderiales bacterium]